MKFNWSKAPKGTTHASAVGGLIWLKKANHGWRFWYQYSMSWEPLEITRSDELMLVERPLKNINMQADKTSAAQIDQHIARQRHLGERAIGDHDKPRMWELAAVTALLVFIGVGTLRGWW